MNLLGLFSFLAPSTPAATETVPLKDIPIQQRTAQQNRMLLADYIEKEVVKGKRRFNMMSYSCCAWFYARESGLFPGVTTRGATADLATYQVDACFGPGAKDFFAAAGCGLIKNFRSGEEVVNFLRSGKTFAPWYG